jgi:hypothetical protein
VSTPELQPGFWRGVRQEALAGIVVLAVGSAGAGIFLPVLHRPNQAGRRAQQPAGDSKKGW